MAGFSAHLRDGLKAYMTGAGTALFTSSPTFYAALYSGDPTDAGSGGTEVTGTIGLSRQAVTFQDDGGDQVSNDTEVNFGTSSGTDTADHIAIFDAAAAGNLLFSVSITSLSIDNSEAVIIPVGNLSINFL